MSDPTSDGTAQATPAESTSADRYDRMPGLPGTDNQLPADNRPIKKGDRWRCKTCKRQHAGTKKMSYCEKCCESYKKTGEPILWSCCQCRKNNPNYDRHFELNNPEDDKCDGCAHQVCDACMEPNVSLDDDVQMEAGGSQGATS